MPQPDWNDLRVLLALHRCRTLNGAARQLRVDSTTVARRLRRLEAALGTQLMQRAADGTWEATQAGIAASARAERIESDVVALDAETAGADEAVAGRVVVSAVPLLVNRLLMPRVGEVVRAHPRLEVDFDASARNLSLVRRETEYGTSARAARGGGRAGEGPADRNAALRRLCGERRGRGEWAARRGLPARSGCSPMRRLRGLRVCGSWLRGARGYSGDASAR